MSIIRSLLVNGKRKVPRRGILNVNLQQQRCKNLLDKTLQSFH